jgi:hypothetical protein
MDDVDAMLLLKPAKIYIVPHLAIKCADLLIDKMSPENVFLIYNRAIVFDEPKLAEVCLRYLDRYGAVVYFQLIRGICWTKIKYDCIVIGVFRQIDKVIVTDEFLEIELETLCTLLSRENLRINECVLFKAVLR